MKKLIFLILSGCLLVARPVDLVPGGSVYCQPLNADLQRCWDRWDRAWLCEFGPGGHWHCRLERW